MTNVEEALRREFQSAFQAGASLAPLTTFKIGGPAEFLVHVETVDELVRAVAIARHHELPVTVVGGGSNLLIADTGLRGLVIRFRGGAVLPAGDALVRAHAGVTINGLVRWTIAHGRAGLEAWAGTPGTVGGAVYGNAHFQGRNISHHVEQVTLLGRDGEAHLVPASEMEFAYDYSRLHRSGEIVVSVDFRAAPGDPEQLRATARSSLAYRKRTQPLSLPSAGCIFQNPDPARDMIPSDVPCSAGALVDRAGLKGAAQGAARVSPVHANFIVNEGAATATDVRALIERCKAAVSQRFGVTLREEIVYLGFEGHPAAVPAGTPGRGVDGHTAY